MRALLKLCLTDQISLQAACVQQRMPTVRQSGRRWAATSRPSKLQCKKSKGFFPRDHAMVTHGARDSPPDRPNPARARRGCWSIGSRVAH